MVPGAKFVLRDNLNTGNRGIDILLTANEMVDISGIPNVPLKVVFIIHFILVSWGLGHWCPLSYLFYNGFLFITLLWAIHHKEGEEPLQMAVAINAVAILLDVLLIAIYFPETHRGSERFSVGMAILNLIVRPVTTLILYRVYAERTNAAGGTLPTIFGVGTSQRSPYEDIDNAVHQTVPRSDIPSPTHFSPSKANFVPPPYHS